MIILLLLSQETMTMMLTNLALPCCLDPSSSKTFCSGNFFFLLHHRRHPMAPPDCRFVNILIIVFGTLQPQITFREVKYFVRQNISWSQIDEASSHLFRATSSLLWHDRLRGIAKRKTRKCAVPVEVVLITFLYIDIKMAGTNCFYSLLIMKIEVRWRFPIISFAVWMKMEVIMKFTCERRASHYPGPAPQPVGWQGSGNCKIRRNCESWFGQIHLLSRFQIQLQNVEAFVCCWSISLDSFYLWH